MRRCDKVPNRIGIECDRPSSGCTARFGNRHWIRSRPAARERRSRFVRTDPRRHSRTDKQELLPKQTPGAGWDSRNLEVILRGTHDQAQPRCRIDKVGKISEPGTPVRRVVNRRRPWSWRLDPAVGVLVLRGHEVTEIAFRSAVLEARLLGIALAAVELNVAAVIEESVLRLDVYNSRGAQAELRRQGAGQQADTLCDPRT